MSLDRIAVLPDHHNVPIGKPRDDDHRAMMLDDFASSFDPARLDHAVKLKSNDPSVVEVLAAQNANTGFHTGSSILHGPPQSPSDDNHPGRTRRSKSKRIVVRLRSQTSRWRILRPSYPWRPLECHGPVPVRI